MNQSYFFLGKDLQGLLFLVQDSLKLLLFFLLDKHRLTIGCIKINLKWIR